MAPKAKINADTKAINDKIKAKQEEKNKNEAATKIQSNIKGRTTRKQRLLSVLKAAKGPSAETITKLLQQQVVAESAGEAVENILKNAEVVQAINKAFTELKDEEALDSLQKFKETMKAARQKDTSPTAPPADLLPTPPPPPKPAAGEASPPADEASPPAPPAELLRPADEAGANAGDGKAGANDERTGGRRSRSSRKARRTRKIRTMNYYRKRGKTKQRKNY
jgi:hypothetical protein